MTLFGDISGNSDYDTNTTGASKYLNDLLLVKKDKLNNDQNSNKRMIAFNESYRKKQGDYIWLLLYVFIALIIFCFFYIMRLFFPFIPDIVMDLLYVNLFAFLILFIAIKIYYIQQRSNMNYDELDIPSNIPKSNDSSNSVTGGDINLFSVIDPKIAAAQKFTFSTDPSSYDHIKGMYFIYYTSTLSSDTIKSNTDDVNVVYIAANGGKLFGGTTKITSTGGTVSHATSSEVTIGGTQLTGVSKNAGKEWFDGKIYNATDTNKLVIGFTM